MMEHVLPLQHLDPIPATITTTPVVTNVICNGESNGTITINVTSGVGPRIQLFDGVTATAFTTNNTFTGLVQEPLCGDRA
jgi:hypothetical protein